jgi:drug/metabolite transporter (DMT)-like permease
MTAASTAETASHGLHRLPPPDRPGRGILLMILSTLLFSVLWTCVKILSQRYSVYEVTFFRNLFAIPPVIVMMMSRRRWRLLRTRSIGSHVWRSVVGVTGMTLGFLAYHLLPLADAVAISFMSPLVVTALSVPLLREKVGIHRWSAVVIGFGGVLVIVNPGHEMLTPGVIVALAAAVASAVAMVTIRQLNRTDRPLTIVFYFTLFSTLFTALPLPFLWSTPRGWDWALLLLMGTTGGVGQYFMTRAFSLAPAAVISPFNYSGLLWASLAGWLLWGYIPATQMFVGAAIVIASGLYILYRETRRRAAARPRPSPDGAA